MAEEICTHPDCDCEVEVGEGVSKQGKIIAVNFALVVKAQAWRSVSVAIRTANDSAAGAV